MILPKDKFDNNFIVAPNNNKSLHEKIEKQINYDKDKFEYFIKTKTWDCFWELFSSTNINEDTKRMLFYSSYSNLTYTGLDKKSILKKSKDKLYLNFNPDECISNEKLCYYKLLEYKTDNAKHTSYAEYHNKIIDNKLKHSKDNCIFKDYKLSNCGATDFYTGASSKADGIITLNNNETILIMASYISDSGGGQTNKLNAQNILATKFGFKTIAIMDGIGSHNLYSNQYKNVYNESKIYTTCANCIPEAIEYFN